VENRAVAVVVDAELRFTLKRLVDQRIRMLVADADDRAGRRPCRGCGCAPDQRSVGCKACSARWRSRRRR
jgi:hypothetical protein